MSIINNGDKVGVKKLQRKRICGQCGFMTENTWQARSWERKAQNL